MKPQTKKIVYIVIALLLIVIIGIRFATLSSDNTEYIDKSITSETKKVTPNTNEGKMITNSTNNPINAAESLESVMNLFVIIAVFMAIAPIFYRIINGMNKRINE